MNFSSPENLSPDDYNHYLSLKATLSSKICRNCRNRRVESFGEMLSAIHCFVTRSNEDMWKRSMVCGVCWYNQNYHTFLCVNIRQMSLLLEKCKSSINGSLQRLHFSVVQNRQQTTKILLEALPFLRNHQDAMKMWSVRQFIPVMQNYRPQFMEPIQMQHPVMQNYVACPNCVSSSCSCSNSSPTYSPMGSPNNAPLEINFSKPSITVMPIIHNDEETPKVKEVDNFDDDFFTNLVEDIKFDEPEFIDIVGNTEGEMAKMFY